MAALLVLQRSGSYRSELFGNKVSLGCRPPWASKWSSAVIQYVYVYIFQSKLVLWIWCDSITLWNSIENLLTIPFRCCFHFFSGPWFSFGKPICLTFALIWKEPIQLFVLARSRIKKCLRQGSEAVIRAFPKISSATKAKMPFPNLPFSLKACLIWRLRDALQWLVWWKTQENWKSRDMIWRLFGLLGHHVKVPKLELKHQNHTKLMACVSPYYFMLTYIKY